MLLMFEIRYCHYCSVDAHANISALFLFRKWICVVLRNRFRSSGAVSGSAVCTHVLYTGLHSCLISSLGGEPFTLLFSHAVESWKSTNTRNLWSFWNVLEHSNSNLDMEWKKNRKKVNVSILGGRGSEAMLILLISNSRMLHYKVVCRVGGEIVLFQQLNILRVCPLWSSRKIPEHSICLFLIIAVRQSLRKFFSKSSSSVEKSWFLHNRTSGWHNTSL